MIDILQPKPKEESRTVVRITSRYFLDNRNGLVMKRRINFLRRQCHGYNTLEEDAVNSGVELAIASIVNLHESPDGVYEVVVCDEHRDWETGHVDDYNYKLVAVA